MPEKFEGREELKKYSEEDIIKIQYLIGKIRKITDWDLGAFEHTSEEEGMLSKAKNAMDEIVVMFDVPGVTIHPNVFSRKESERKPDKAFSPDDLQKLRSNLDVIAKEASNWYTRIKSADNLGEKTVLKEARESLEELKNIL